MYVGTLIVDRAAWSEFYVDRPARGPTPASLPDVSAGSHAIRLEARRYRRWTLIGPSGGDRTKRVTASPGTVSNRRGAA